MASQDLFAFEIPSVRDDLEILAIHCGLRLLRYRSQLAPVIPDIGDLMGNDQVMPGVHGGLDVVARDAGSLAAWAIERASGSVSEICLSAVACTRISISLSCCMRFFSAALFSFSFDDLLCAVVASC